GAPGTPPSTVYRAIITLRSVPGRALHADEAVGDTLVATKVLRKGHDVVLVIEVDDVASRREEVDRLAVESAALVHVTDLARPVEELVDALVAGLRRVEAALARLGLVDVAVGIDAAAPAHQVRLVLAVVVVLQRGGELLGPERDVEARLARHALDDL